MPDVSLDPSAIRSALEGARTVAATEAALSEILRLSEAGDSASACERAWKLLREGVTDIRVITAYAQGIFSARGPKSLDGILEALHFVITSGVDRVFPVERRTKTIDGALSAMLRAVARMWDMEVAGQHVPRPPWGALSRDEASLTLERSSALREAAEASLPRSRSVDQLSELDRHLRRVMERAPAIVSAPPVSSSPEPAPAAFAASAADASSDGLSPDQPRALPSHAPVAPSEEAAGAVTLTIVVSPAMALLLARLRAFEVLIGRGDFTRAAVVSEELRRAIEAFDPRAFLPTLFARHFALLSEHVATLAPLWESTGTAEWRVLEQHCQVDLEGFIGRP